MAGHPPDSPTARLDPNRPDSPWAGVGAVLIGDGVFSGALIGPRHVLTAAHVAGGQRPGRIQFQLNPGPEPLRLAAQAVHVHPRFKGVPRQGWPHYDLAIVELAAPAPAHIPVYERYYGSLRPYTPLTFVGYGASGNGNTGPTVAGRADARRVGMNRADAFVLSDEDAVPLVFLYDFDGPGLATNTLGGPSLGNAVETSAAGGDSGAPAFIVQGDYRQLVGVLTFVTELGRPGAARSRFGGSGGGTLVSAAREWIERIVAER